MEYEMINWLTTRLTTLVVGMIGWNDEQTTKPSTDFIPLQWGCFWHIHIPSTPGSLLIIFIFNRSYIYIYIYLSIYPSIYLSIYLILSINITLLRVWTCMWHLRYCHRADCGICPWAIQQPAAVTAAVGRRGCGLMIQVGCDAALVEQVATRHTANALQVKGRPQRSHTGLGTLKATHWCRRTLKTLDTEYCRFVDIDLPEIL